jgi:hypothetical protein
MFRMIALLACLSLSAPAAAQAVPEAPPATPREGMREGLGLMEQGTRRLLEGLLREFGSAVEGLEEALRDMTAYYPPEVLPNGDIIIRRRTPLVPEAPDDGPVDL